MHTELDKFSSLPEKQIGQRLWRYSEGELVLGVFSFTRGKSLGIGNGSGCKTGVPNWDLSGSPGFRRSVMWHRLSPLCPGVAKRLRRDPVVSVTDCGQSGKRGRSSSSVSFIVTPRGCVFPPIVPSVLPVTGEFAGTSVDAANVAFRIHVLTS